MSTYSQSTTKRHTDSAQEKLSSGDCSLLRYLPVSHLQTMRYFIISIFVIAVICIGSSMIVNANTVNTSGQTRYYTSICIEENDTLWDIEKRYNSGTENRNSYIQTIMKMNHMSSDILYSGQNLIIYYYAADEMITQE